MRKITQKAVESFRNLKPYKSNNTKVEIREGEAFFYLHDNMIAHKHKDGLYITNCGWFSNTTKERLNGILNAYKLPLIYQKNFVWYIGEGQEFKGNKNFKI